MGKTDFSDAKVLFLEKGFQLDGVARMQKKEMHLLTQFGPRVLSFDNLDDRYVNALNELAKDVKQDTLYLDRDVLEGLDGQTLATKKPALMTLPERSVGEENREKSRQQYYNRMRLICAAVDEFRESGLAPFSNEEDFLYDIANSMSYTHEFERPIEVLDKTLETLSKAETMTLKR